MSIRESRVSLFSGMPLAATAISTATTTNGSTIDFKSGYTGNYFEGAQYKYGFNVHLLFTSIVSTNNNVVVKWQVSDDGSTWRDSDEVLRGELSVLMGTNGGTKVEVPSRLVTNRRYARLVITTTGMSGSSFNVNAWVDEGSGSYANGQPLIRV